MNALGRGQDRESLTQFLMTIAQTMGPQAIMQYIDPSEYIKRLAAAQGIDTLNLIKSQDQLQAENQQAMDQQKEMELVKQTGQLANAPANDPSKNPALNPESNDGTEEAPPPPQGAG